MIDLAMLNEVIKGSGKTQKHIAEVMGLTREGLRLKLIGRSDFKTEEVNSICRELGINNAAMRNRIFFAKKVENKSTEDAL